MRDLIIRQKELVENPTPRVPICLVLDASGSMTGLPIAELNDGIHQFFNAVKNDETARYAADIAMVTFGGVVKHLLDFSDIERQQVPLIEAEGGTPMGEAVTLALDLLEQRKQEFSDAGVDYYQPWMVLMTDGHPTDDIAVASARSSDMVERRKLTVFPIAIGDAASMQALEQFSPKREPLRLKGLAFEEFFEWLSMSVSRASQSTPGDDVPLDTGGIKGWASL